MNGALLFLFGKMMPLDPPYELEIGMAIPKEREMSPAARRFARFVMDRFHG